MSKRWCASFPIGFRFDPDDELLVSFYLWRKVHEGLDLPNGPIVEADVYAHEPWFLQYHGNDPAYMAVNNDRYFFVKREPVSRNGNGKRIKRDLEGDSDGGWWKANTGDMEIKDSDGHLVGYMKSLTFFKYKNKERIRKEATKTDWIMHEYRLASDSQFQSWTLCRIRYRGHDHVQHGPRTDPSASEQAFLDTRITDINPSSDQLQASSGTGRIGTSDPSWELVSRPEAHDDEIDAILNILNMPPEKFQAFLESVLVL
ncbi:NAC domain-containing protein 83-like [Carya illinoinensis]|uniref:NAC domain-containing protein 83-like n=1 Tax=Carya illinoinensis TaxID=32201 RepID=UPI001C71B9C5|nr:NAC domain-containing protein 83-like [Carya illinoinensis]